MPWGLRGARKGSDHIHKSQPIPEGDLLPNGVKKGVWGTLKGQSGPGRLRAWSGRHPGSPANTRTQKTQQKPVGSWVGPRNCDLHTVTITQIF